MLYFLIEHWFAGCLFLPGRPARTHWQRRERELNDFFRDPGIKHPVNQGPPKYQERGKCKAKWGKNRERREGK